MTTQAPIKRFNTSGPNWPEQHYTLPRTDLVHEGLQLVQQARYFTIWAPRQGGKSTYFELLMAQLRQQGHQVVHLNFESFSQSSPEGPMAMFQLQAQKHWGIAFNTNNITDWQQAVMRQTQGQWVLIIDEIEGLNPALLPNFLHTVRSLYHYRKEHALKSVIFVGVANLAGIMADLNQIEHVETVRFHTRFPVVIPDRICDDESLV